MGKRGWMGRKGMYCDSVDNCISLHLSIILYHYLKMAASVSYVYNNEDENEYTKNFQLQWGWMFRASLIDMQNVLWYGSR